MPLATQNPISSTVLKPSGRSDLLAPKHDISNSAPIVGGHKDVQGSLQPYEKDCRRHEDNPSRKNGMKVWKNYTTDDAIVVTEKAVKAIKPETKNPCQRKLCPEAVRDFTGFTVELIKEITKETADVAKN